MRNEYTITSNQDNLKISVLEYTCKEPIAIVQLAHGMSEHKERYEELMAYLCEKGFICCINDHRGHGNSVKDVNDYGYFYDKTADYIVEDLHQITNHLKDKYPNLPVYLFGHSMGSLVVRKYIKKYDKDIEKLIVCGSPSENNMASMGIFIANMISIFKGDHYRSPLLTKIAFGGYDKRFKEDIPNTWLNSNIEEVKKYNNDSKCSFIFTTNGYLNLLKLLRDTYSRKGWLHQNPNLKILFIAGSDDPVIVNESAWLNSMTFLREIGYERIDHILYPGDRHEILKEKNKEEVFKDIYKFFKED